jgi:hypothetical protein
MISVRYLLVAGLFSLVTSLSVAAQGCSTPQPLGGDGYSLARDSGTYVVTALGTVLSRPAMPVDEDDRIVLLIRTTKKQAPFLRVKRISATRVTGTISVAGGENLHLDADDKTQCEVAVVLSDFAPGKGEVEIENVRIDEDSIVKTTSLGRFDFAVNPLYTGAFSFGPVMSSLKDASFSIIKKGSDSLVTQTRVGNDRLLYAVMYTPFVWGKRDLDKPAKELWHRLNPTLGMTLKDLLENAFVGVSVDLPFGVYLTYGLHAGKVTELDPESGVVLGQTYPGSSVPTRTRWETDRFFATTVDLRAALKLIKAVTTTTL